MIEVQVSVLIGPALDWAVAKAVGEHIAVMPGMEWKTHVVWSSPSFRRYAPSTDWAQGGPLLDEHDIFFSPYGRVIMATGTQRPAGIGETRLIAACRLIVEAALGLTVSVPVELMGLPHE